MERTMPPAPDLAITRVVPEWCAAEAGGAVLLLVLTSVRTAWLTEIGNVIRSAAQRHPSGRAAVLGVYRLDKRYPLDVGFDRNFHELREGHREIAPFIRASSMALEFGGVLALTMRAAVATMSLLVKQQYPQTIHSSVVAATSSLLPYVDERERRDVAYYTAAVDRLRMELGCEPR
jgi:hypothetical protein